MADLLQVGPDGLIEAGGLGGLGAEFSGQAGHLVFERIAVGFDFSSADKAARRQDV
jgi:hypothetical protein